ncbi:hypothetical protein D5R81_15830 [Parashewanella spongiae]|uniref:Uncharacterized protein n=2 Tax=Parashewanella spongiae TaxID=342950 RepID=A0A3A6TG36_9GAMM|nr:hypothetical protein D5R81_15830 [Parashewanella spongiae]
MATCTTIGITSVASNWESTSQVLCYEESRDKADDLSFRWNTTPQSSSFKRKLFNFFDYFRRKRKISNDANETATITPSSNSCHYSDKERDNSVVQNSMDNLHSEQHTDPFDSLKYLAEEEEQFKQIACDHSTFLQPAMEMLNAIKENKWDSSIFKRATAYDYLLYLYLNKYINEELFGDIQINWLQPLTQFDKDTEITAEPLLGKFTAKSVERVCFDEVSSFFNEKLTADEQKLVRSMPRQKTWYTKVVLSKDSKLEKYLTGEWFRSRPNTYHGCTEAPCETEVGSWIGTFDRLISSFKLHKPSTSKDSDVIILLPSYHIVACLRDFHSVNPPKDRVKPFLCFASPNLEEFIQLRREKAHPVSLYHQRARDNLLKPDKCQSGCFGGSYHDLVHLEILSRFPAKLREDALDIYSHIQNLEVILKSETSPEKSRIIYAIGEIYKQALATNHIESRYAARLKGSAYSDSNIRSIVDRWAHQFKADNFVDLVDMDFITANKIGSITFLSDSNECLSADNFCHIVLMLMTLNNLAISEYFLTQSLDTRSNKINLYRMICDFKAKNSGIYPNIPPRELLLPKVN